MTQDEALQILKNGYNVYLTGAAGSGKTYLLNTFIRHLKDERTYVAVTASTGIAATHLEGTTIHSWAGIGLLRAATDKQILAILDKKRIGQRLRKAEVLVIDEISMLDADRLDLVDKVARAARANSEPFGGMQVVLCGDFFQLPPVARYDEEPPRAAHQSEAWQNLDLRVCYLHEQHRQGDGEYLRVLNAIRDAEVDETVVEHLRRCRTTELPAGLSIRFVRLYSHNMDVDSENRRELVRLPGKEYTYEMKTSGIPAIVESLKAGCLAPERLVLKKDAAVMFVKNNFEEGYVNGTIGKVSGFDEKGFPVVRLGNGSEIVAAPATWSVEENERLLAEATQVPLRLAWAITVHKSQGMTLDAAQVDLSRCFEKGMGYVALSRVRSRAGLRLLGFNDMALRVSEETLDFDAELRENSEAALRELKSSPHAEPAIDETVAAKHYSVDKIREKHPAAYSKWTPDEEARLVAGFHSGKSQAQLSEMLGREPGGIRARLIKLGLVEQ